MKIATDLVMSTQVLFHRRSPSNKFSSIFDSTPKFLRDPTTETGLNNMLKNFNARNYCSYNTVKDSLLTGIVICKLIYSFIHLFIYSFIHLSISVLLPLFTSIFLFLMLFLKVIKSNENEVNNHT